MNRTEIAVLEFAARVAAGNMTAEHVTRSLRPGSTLAKAWAAHLALHPLKG